MEYWQCPHPDCSSVYNVRPPDERCMNEGCGHAHLDGPLKEKPDIGPSISIAYVGLTVTMDRPEVESAAWRPMWDTVQRWNGTVQARRQFSPGEFDVAELVDAAAAMLLTCWQLCDYFHRRNRTVTRAAQKEIRRLKEKRGKRGKTVIHGGETLHLAGDFTDTYKHAGRFDPENVATAWFSKAGELFGPSGRCLVLKVTWERPGETVPLQERDFFEVADEIASFWTGFIERHKLT